MAPNLDSPTATGTKSNEQKSQLVYIEETLRRLEKDTLRIKKKNDEIIQSFDRRISGPNSVQYSQYDNKEPPPKPPRRPQPKPRQLRPEVTQALQESADVRQKMHDTLKACAEDKERHRKRLNEMRLEGQQLMSVQQSSCATTIPASSVLSKTKDVFRGFLKKLSYSDSNSSQITSSQTQKLTGAISSSIPRSNEVANDFEKENKNRPISPSRTPPKPKPRIKSKPVIPLPDLNPVSIPYEQVDYSTLPSVATIDDLRKICQTATDDESTLPPRIDHKSKNQFDVTTDSGSEDESDDSSSDFGEYIEAPLLVNTFMTASTDSDESLLDNPRSSNNKSGFSKNRKSGQVPKAYRKSKVEEIQEPILALEGSSNRVKLGHLQRNKLPRPPSPPPRKLVRTPSLTTKLPNLCEEEFASPYTDSLLVPYAPRLQSPPPSPLRSIDDFSETTHDEYEKRDTLSRTVPHIQISALCQGVPIRPVDISVTPWIVTERPIYKIYGPELNPQDSDDSSIQDVIDINFGFLSDIEDISEEENKIPLVAGIQEIKDDLPEKKVEIASLGKSLVKIDSSPPIAVIDCEPHILEFPDPLENTNSGAVKTRDDTIVHNFEIWNNFVGSIEQNSSEISKICLYQKAITTESVNEFQTNEDPETMEILSSEICIEPNQIMENQFSCQIIEEEKEVDLKPRTLPRSAPPPPPAMPLVPIFLETIGSKRNANLPITPWDNSSGQLTIFDNLQPIGDNRKSDLDFDMKFIEDNFKQESSPTSGTSGNGRRMSFIVPSKEKTDTDSSNQSTVSYLTQNRRQVIEIGTKKLKLKPTRTETILSALRCLDVEKLSVDEIQILMQILPKDNEKIMYECLESTKCETLCEEDMLLKSLSEIPQVDKKLEAMNFIQNFDETIMTLESEITLLKKSAQSVMQSKNFPKIIQIVLVVINKAFVKDAEPLRGFEINSLQRLANKKSADGKVSLLHCITKCLESTYPEAIHFYNDFLSIEEASKVSRSDVCNLFKDLENGMHHLRQEISAIKATRDDKTMDRLLKASVFVDKSTAELANIKQMWQDALEEVQKVTEFFGMSAKQTVDIRDFFLIILNFVNDYKKALAQNEKLFKVVNSDPKPETFTAGRNQGLACNEPVVKRRNTNASSSLVDPHRRRSLGGSLKLSLQDLESEQPSEFVDAVSKIGQFNADARQRRRASFYGPTPYRKSNKGLKEESNRER